MEWNVYLEDINKREIEVFNVFDHWRFNEDVMKLLKKKGKMTREEFAEQLRKDALYYFLSKSEYEIIITSWPAYISKSEWDRLKSEDCKYRCMIEPEVGIKVDVYDQLRLNWDAFVDYVLSFKK